MSEKIHKNTTHGMKYTSEYNIWASMKARCLNPNNKDYLRYGGKGIKICNEWENSFEQFYKDMGNRPDGYSIDRIDNTKGYYKENCKWSDRHEQQKNKINSRIYFIKGEEFDSLLSASKFFNRSRTQIKRWISGHYDKRRNTYTEPRNDCKQIFKY